MRDFDKALWPRLSPLFDRALDLESSDRDALIAGLRDSDPVLAEALVRLLDKHERVAASDFLESAPLERHATASMAGQTVGGYTLIRQLGAGGMGTVWLAHRSDGRFEGQVAIKFVNLAVLDDRAQARFRREGTLLARLSHPHIARLFDAGVSEAGQPFLVLEYIEGIRIDRYGAEQTLGVDERLDLLLQVMDAVAHAHANLVVHRDLKPSNVLVDSQGRVKLLDFGIAALLDDESMSGPSTLTLDGGRVLTPEYAAPEQAAGGVVTTATDVYALGVLLYQLLVGRHPTTPAGMTSHTAILRALAEEEPRRVSDVIAALPPGPDTQRLFDERKSTRDRLIRAYRGDLDTIVAKALKKDPGERYQSVIAFADDLRRHRRNEPVSARPDSLWYRTRKLAKRRRLEFGAAAAIVVALIAGAGIAVTQAQRSARERDRALELLRRAEATNDFSSILLSQATPRGRPISNAELLKEGEAAIDRQFATDPVLRVHMLLTLAARYEENQQFDQWQRLLQRAYADSRALSDEPLRAYVTCAWAMPLTEHGSAPRALALIEEVLPAVAFKPDYADYESACRIFESVAARTSGNAHRAVTAAQRALALEEERPGTPVRELEALDSLGAALSAAFRYADSDVTYARLVAQLEGLGLGETRRTVMVLNDWSVMLLNSGQFSRGSEIAGRAVRAARTADSENGASISMLTSYATALFVTGEHVPATSAFDEAIEKAGRAGSPTRFISVLASATGAACAGGDVVRAKRLLGEAERLLSADKSAYSRGLVEAAAARVALASNDTAEAVSWARRALTTLESAGNTSTLANRTLLARTLNADGQHAEALTVAERSVAVAEERTKHLKRSAPVGLALLEVAGARQGLGEEASAREVLGRSLQHLHATYGPKADTTLRAERLRQSLGAQP